MSTATQELEATDAQEQFKAEAEESTNETTASADGAGDEQSAAAAQEPTSDDVANAANDETAPSDAAQGTSDVAATVNDQQVQATETATDFENLLEWAERIEAQEAECARLQYDYSSAKEQTKEAKALYEGAVAELRAMIRQSRDPQRKLPFRQAESKPATTVVAPASEAAPESAAEPAPDPDAWKTVSIDVLGLTPRIVKALHEAGLDTLGKIADYSANNDGLNGVTGIGPAAREQVSDAMENYWRDHPQPSVETASDEFDDDDSDNDDTDEYGEEE